jgi:hypothetical protein
MGSPAWGIALPADAGTHDIVATAPGHRAFETRVEVSPDAETTSVRIPALAPLPAANVVATIPPSGTTLGTARIAAIVAGGVGIVGVGLGTAFGLVSVAKHDEAEKYCDGAECTDRRGVTAGDSARAAGNVSTVAIIVGGIGLATSVTLWLTAPKTKRDAPSAQIGLTLGGMQIKRSF